MLTGKALVEFVQQNEDLNQTQLAREAGYVRTTETGREQVLVKSFYEALLKAQGLKMKVGKAPGKSARYTTTVHRSGVVLVGKIYSQRFGLKPGDPLEIVLEDDCIKLVPRDEPAAA